MALSKFLVRIRFNKDQEDNLVTVLINNTFEIKYYEGQASEEELSRLLSGNPQAYGRLGHYGETRIRQGFERTVYRWFESKNTELPISDIEPWIKDEIKRA